MPPRKSFPLSDAERQRESRAKKEAIGLLRREFLLPVETIDDENYIREREGVDRVRQLICWVLRKEAKRISEGG